MRPRRSLAGFTLIELLMVIAVVGILVGLVLPSTDPSIADQLQSTAEVLAGELAYGRSLAVADNSTYRFRFDLTQNRIILEYSGSTPGLSVLPQTPFRSSQDTSTQRIIALDDLPQIGARVQIAAVADSANGSVSDVEFGPLGQTTRSDATTIWLQAGQGLSTRYMWLSIDPVTGLVDVGPLLAVGPPGLSPPGANPFR